MIKSVYIDSPFSLESGKQIEELQIAYHTFGKLNADKDNVIWVCHALTASSNLEEWWPGLFGAGNVFDTDKFYIICANNLGSPYGTTSAEHFDPKTKKRYGMDFPEFSIRDSAKLLILLMEQLDISNIYLLMGGSCGGNIALEFAFLQQEKIRNLALLCSSAKEQPWTIGIHHAQRMILEADPNFTSNASQASPHALATSRAVALPFYRTSKSINSRQNELDNNKPIYKVESYLNYQGSKFAKRFDSQCYYQLLKALDTHHIGKDRGSIEQALTKVKARTICIGIDSDLFIPCEEQVFLSKHIPNATLAVIKSAFGHDGFLIEVEQIKKIISEWMMELPQTLE